MMMQWEKPYLGLLVDLNKAITDNGSEAGYAAAGFNISMEYWLLVKEQFIARCPHNDKEEIYFFRSIKPRFTRFIEYYLILNQALLFIPERKTARKGYWFEETGRYDRFYAQHQGFIRYYENGSQEMDDQYFLSRNNHRQPATGERIYADENCRSSHDHLIRRLLANRLYLDFVKKKLPA